MSKVIAEFRCNICNKSYSGYQSLWIHNKKFHNIQVTSRQHTNNIQVASSQHTNNIQVADTYIKYVCKYCNNEYTHKQSKYRHEKTCQNKNNTNIKTENNNLKQEITEIIKSQFTEILKLAKIHPKTLQKINNQLINNTNTNNSNNNNTTNNGTIINNTFVKFGNENLAKILSKKDMLNIINKNCLSLEESIKTVHFNRHLPEYNNIFITNMRDSVAYIFDGHKFILTSKDEVINDLYSAHLDNLETFITEAEIPDNKYKKISKFLETLNDDEETFVDGCNNNKKYSNYKAYKLTAIKQLVYNESDGKLLKQLNKIDLYEKLADEVQQDDSVSVEES